MSSPARNFDGDIPAIYDRYLGPVLFKPAAADMVARIPHVEGGTVLELACGTGIVTQKLRSVLPESTKIVATDLSPAMLSIARTKLQDAAAIEFREVDAQALPFGDRSMDVVVCQFGVMFFEDKDKAMREIFRVLVPNGLAIFSAWDAIEHNLTALLTQEVMQHRFAPDPPKFYDVPFGYYDRAEIRRLLTSAGFSDVSIDTVKIDSDSPSAGDFATGIVFGTPMIDYLKEHVPDHVHTIKSEVATRIAATLGDHPLRTDLQFVVAQGTKPN